MSREAEPTVVLLNGPAGVGKTTVGRQLAARARNGVCIHGDDLKGFVVSRDLSAVRTGLTYVGCAALSDVYLQAGYQLVVVDFIFKSRRDVQRFLDALASDAAVYLFTLWAPLTTIVSREGGRTGRPSLGDRVGACWNELAAVREELGTIIDAAPAPDRIVETLIGRLDATDGKVRG